MSFETLQCNECGARLQVPTVARYATCNRCGAHLAVHRTGDASYTEAAPRPSADAPAADLREVSGRLEQLQSENELARIDRDWDREREQYMFTSRYGRRYIPNQVAAVVMGVLAVGFGLFWIVMSLGLTENFNGGGVACYFPVFGVVFIAAALVISTYQFRMAQRYRTAQQEYERRRAQAVDKSVGIRE